MIKIETDLLAFPSNSNLSMFIDVLCAGEGGKKESLEFQDQNLQQYLVNVHELSPTTSLPARSRCPKASKYCSSVCLLFYWAVKACPKPG